MRNRSLANVFLTTGIICLVAILGLIGYVLYQKSVSTEAHSVELRSSATPLEMVTESLSREVLRATAPAMGSLSVEGFGGVDPILNPAANVVVQCDGSGYAEFDNSRSTTAVGFELLVGDSLTYYSVEGGTTMRVEFLAPAGATVVAQTGEAIPYAIVPVPMCSAAR